MEQFRNLHVKFNAGSKSSLTPVGDLWPWSDLQHDQTLRCPTKLVPSKFGNKMEQSYASFQSVTDGRQMDPLVSPHLRWARQKWEGMTSPAHSIEYSYHNINNYTCSIHWSRKCFLKKRRNFKMPYLPYFSLNFHNSCTTICKGKFSCHLPFNSHRLISSDLLLLPGCLSWSDHINVPWTAAL